MPAPFTPNLLGLASTVEWGKSWHWDIKFEGAPAPFNNWFPAYECDRTLLSLESFDFNGGVGAFRVPHTHGARDIQLSFYDNDQAVLESWLDAWFNQRIFNNGTVATLEEATRLLYVSQLTATNQVAHTHVLTVYPEGSTRVMRDSQPGAALLLQNFAIVGYERY